LHWDIRSRQARLSGISSVAIFAQAVHRR